MTNTKDLPETILTSGCRKFYVPCFEHLIVRDPIIDESITNRIHDKANADSGKLVSPVRKKLYSDDVLKNGIKWLNGQ